ncbi:MAG: XdhC family protein [Saprospiraceae bacterium]
MKLTTIKFILQKLQADIPTMLLQVVHSEGSSPGRQGFQMAIANDGQLFGSIGGGIMEHKLVELSKQKLSKIETTVELKFQYHDKIHSTQQSGMICSGNQIIAFFPFYKKNTALLQQIEKSIESKKSDYLFFSKKGISIISKNDLTIPIGFHQNEINADWSYIEKMNQQKVIHIFGGGHVSLALSEVMNFLGFHIKIYDDREAINTLQENNFCHEKHLISYDSIGTQLENCQDDFVVIMTFGYRPDKIVLKQLLGKDFFYIGMMGSKAKIKTLLEELEMEGFSKKSYEHIFTPIGLKIFSKTPQEIAISIAAEIIGETNREK